MNQPPTQPVSHNSFPSCSMAKQSGVFNSEATVNRPNSDQIWLEVAKRYQQIIEKDIKLRQYLRRESVVPHINFQNDCRRPRPESMQNVRLGNNQPLPTSNFPVAFKKRQSLNVTALRQGTETFPQIVKVFSLNPSLPAQIFRDNVTVKITPNGLIAQPVGGESIKTNASKQNEIRWLRSSENFREKRNLIDHDKKLTQPSRPVTKETNLGDTRFQRNHHADILDYIDITSDGCEAKIGSLKEGNCGREIHRQSGHNSVVKEDIRNKDAMVSVNKQDVSEWIYSQVNANSKRKKGRRKAIFGIRRSKKRCLVGDLYCVKGNERRDLDGEKCISDDDAYDKNCHFECCNSLKDADMGSTNIINDQNTTEEIQEEIQDSCSNPSNDSNDNEKQSQERARDNCSNASQDGDENNATIPNTSQTDLKSASVIDDDNDSGHSTLVKISPLHGNDTRQNKIIDLKAKLAQQEQELQNLKQRKDLEDVEKEDCAPHVGPEEANLEPMDDDAFLKYENIFDFSHQTDVMSWEQDKEKEDELNLGKIEDLIDIFQKEIKTFKLPDTELYPVARRVTNYDYLQTWKYAVSENDKRLFAGIDSQMKFVPEDFVSKEEFLFQLGLLRIYN